MIAYQTRNVPKVGEVIDVFLEGKKTGTIYRVVGGWQYQISVRNLAGEVFASLEEVKKSLKTS